jgi:M6 family metalloprotease-like protein
MLTVIANLARTVRGAAALTALSLLLLLVAAGSARAVPVDPTQRLELRQPDGTTFPAKAFGDEWYNGYETPAGYTVVRDADTRTWEYAEREGSHLEASGLEPGEDRPTGLDKHLRDPSRSDPPPGAGPDRVVTSANVGTHRSLVILVQFADQQSLGTAPAQWSSRFFGASDSVRDYYDEVSFGRLDIAPAAEVHGTAGDGVVGWLTLPSNHPRDNGTLHRATVRDAVAAASPYVDFRSFDTDGNGSITSNELHVTVIPAGWEASRNCGMPAVWGHHWTTFDLTPTVDGVRVGSGGYTMFGEQHCDRDQRRPPRMATLGIIVHEMGHDLGLPDLYDVDGSSNSSDFGGVGYWSVMAAGSWLALPGSDPGSHPPHPDPFSKAYEGWIQPRQAGANGPATTLLEAGANPSAVQVLDNPGGIDWSFHAASGTGEYFLLENRQRVGYDRALPGCGVLIWHIDETRAADKPNAQDDRRMVQLEEADANRSPFGQGDAFLGSAAFSDTSNPNSRLYDGSSSGIRAANFSSACAPAMSVDLSVGSVVPGLANDAFGSALAIGALPFTQTLDTTGATVEAGEPAPSCAMIGKTAWFRFTPAQNVRLRADTVGSNFDTVLAVHRGNALGALAETACADDIDFAAGNLRSSVEFDAVAGQTYHVQVGGFRAASGVVGAGRLTFSLVPVGTPGGGGGGGGQGGGGGGGGQDRPDSCASTPAPAPARLGPPRLVRVAPNGRFRYRFRATAGLDGRIQMRARALRASGAFTVPASGNVTLQVRLSRRTRQALRRYRRMHVAVGVKLGDACGRSSSARGRIVLVQ